MLPRLIPTIHDHTLFQLLVSHAYSPEPQMPSHHLSTMSNVYPNISESQEAYTTVRSLSKQARVSSNPEDSAAKVGYLRSVSAFGDDEDGDNDYSCENAGGDYETDQDAVRASTPSTTCHSPRTFAS